MRTFNSCPINLKNDDTNPHIPQVFIFAVEDIYSRVFHCLGSFHPHFLTVAQSLSFVFRYLHLLSLNLIWLIYLPYVKLMDETDFLESVK